MSAIAGPLDAPQPCEFITCPRCGSDVYLDGVEWPDPAEREPGEVASVWINCYVEGPDGGDPMGEFDDGDPCNEDIAVGRLVLDDGSLGPFEVLS